MNADEAHQQELEGRRRIEGAILTADPGYHEFMKITGETDMDMKDYAGAESNYLKASDIKGHTPTVLIEKVEIVKFEDKEKAETKPAIFFAGKEKGVVLNKTNVRSIIEAYGTESDHWLGKNIMLSVVATEMGDGIRVTPLQNNPAQEAPSW